MGMKDADEELVLFLEGNENGPLSGSGKTDAPAGFNCRSSPMLEALSINRKMGSDELLNFGDDKNDLVWLLSPPGIPLTATAAKLEENGHFISQIPNSSPRPAFVPSLVESIQPEAAPEKPIESKSSLPSQSKSSSKSCKSSSSSGPPSSANYRASTTTARSMVPATSKPSRSTTPSRVANQPSSTNPGGHSAPRSSTPNRFTTARSSTPTRRASTSLPKTTSKPSVPNIQPLAQSIMKSGVSLKVQALSASATKSRVVVPRSSATPASEPRLSKPSNSMSLASSLPRRPVSASRIRPSPSASASDKSFPPIKSRRPSNQNDEVNPVLMGTKMVERIVNMRKLAPPMQDAHLGSHENLLGKHSLLMASSGFGRSLSKKSLDMAIRHMDITGSKPGKLNKLRTGPTKSNSNTGVSDSPLAMSSNASSDLLSLNSNSSSIDGSETEDNDLGTEKVCPMILHGR